MQVPEFLCLFSGGGAVTVLASFPGQRHDAVREAHGIPEDRRLVGVIALGAPAARAAHTGGSPRTRPRRPLEDVLHEGRFGGWSGASA